MLSRIGRIRARELVGTIRIGDMLGGMRLVIIGALGVVVAGCGMLQPTPARHRPPLPDAVAMPDLAVEAVVGPIELMGYDCAFSPDSDIPGGWSCLGGDQTAGDWTQVSFAAQETGPIERVAVHRSIQVAPDTGPDPSVLDRAAAATFRPVIDLIVPEEHRPSDDDLLSGVQRNYPMELGSGWFIGFDRSSVLRSLNIVFAGDG